MLTFTLLPTSTLMWQRKGRILPITLRQALSNPKKPRWIHQKREKKWGGERDTVYSC